MKRDETQFAVFDRSMVNSDDLGTAFAQIGEEFTTDQAKDYSVVIEGTPQQLHPIIAMKLIALVARL